MDLHESLSPFIGHMIKSGPNEGLPRFHKVIFTNTSLLIRGDNEITQCQFNEQIQIRTGISVVFKNCVFLKGINLFKETNGNVHLVDCHVLGEILFLERPQTQQTYKLILERSQFPKNYTLQPYYFNLEIKDTNFNRLLLKSQVYHLTISGNSTIDFLSISNSHLQILELIHCTINRISLQSPGSLTIKMANFKSNEMVEIHNEFEKLDVSNSTFLRLKITNSRALACLINIQNSEFKESLEVVNYITDQGEINVNHIVVKDLTFANILETAKIELVSLEKVSSLIFDRVRSKVNLTGFTIQRLSIKNSDFGRWTFGYIHWANNFKLFHPEMGLNDGEKHLQLMETSRSLKRHFSSINHDIYSDIFKVSELTSYYFYLKFKLRKMNITISQFVDFLVLGTNKWFSSFGTSPLRAFSWLVIFHSIFFLLLIKSTDLGLKFCFSWSSNCNLGLWLHFLNPVHKLPEINGKAVYSSVDFFMRLSSGYFIYYFLKATRKFGR